MSIGDRLSYARKRVGLTLSQTSERTGVGESSLSEFEHDKRAPSVSQLQALADTYHRSIGFFFDRSPLPEETVLWRQRPEGDAESIEAEFLQLCQQYRHLEVWCRESVPVALPEDDSDPQTYGYGQAEALSIRVRQELNLGDRPAFGLLRVLEETCGVKVLHLEFQPTGTAACALSEFFGAGILLNRLNVRWRRNFDLAHELFHLLTWRVFRSVRDEDTSTPTPKEEQLATCFARYLLMPEEPLKVALAAEAKGDNVSYEALAGIARQFDVSADALLWHLHMLCGRGVAGREATQRDIERTKAFQSPEGRSEGDRPPLRPERYYALGVKALLRGELSLGRFASYLGMSRQRASKYLEQSRSDDGADEVEGVLVNSQHGQERDVWGENASDTSA